ncbi:MAG TPA: sterol desaturase family protein [Pyrinomonadaceae bacterium]|jgi:4-hydroxysphinganine ceramide fatty acyl 2-hydroxylase
MNLSPKIEQQQAAETLNERVLSRIAQSKATYWFGFFTDPLTVVFLVCWDVFALRRSSFYAIAAAFVAGLFTWTLVEYCFHRWVYHKGETLAHAGHLLHHDEPEALIGMPWFLTSGIMYSLWFIFGYLLALGAASSYISGWLTGFVAYYSFHHILHHQFNFKSGWYRRLRAHHKIHHQIPESNFGVTNRLWDQVFGTTYRKSERTMKKRMSSDTTKLNVAARTDASAPVETGRVGTMSASRS